MTSIIFSDYRLICGFMDKCKEDINNLRCGSINIGHKVTFSSSECLINVNSIGLVPLILEFAAVASAHQDIHSQGEVIACLEKALVKEAEQQDQVRPIKEECQRAILRVAELSSDDFHLDRHLYFSCRDDRERFCQNVISNFFLFFELFT